MVHPYVKKVSAWLGLYAVVRLCIYALVLYRAPTEQMSIWDILSVTGKQTYNGKTAQQ